jgi:hypothetical protein
MQHLLMNLCINLCISGRQVMAIPIQQGGNLSTILKAANIKMEGGTHQMIQPRPGGSPMMMGNNQVMVS